MLDGGRTSHLLDPATGVGVVGRPAVTVVAEDATTADGLASALSVVGPASEARLSAAIPSARVWWEH